MKRKIWLRLTLVIAFSQNSLFGYLTFRGALLDVNLQIALSLASQVNISFPKYLTENLMCLVFPDGICLKRFATRGHLIEIFSVLPILTPCGKRALTIIFWPLTEVNVLETGGEDWFSALPQNSESVGRGEGVENSISESSGDSGRNVSVFVDVGEFVWYPWSSRSSSSFSFASLDGSLNSSS